MMTEEERTKNRIKCTNKWRKAHPEEVKAANRKRREADPVKAAQDTKAWRIKNPEQQKALTATWRSKNSVHYKAIKNKLSAAWTLAKQEAAAGRPRPELCEICNQRPNGRTLHFDHCHKSKKFRGWICFRCNLALGYVSDSIERLASLTKYLKKHAV
jgi:hypothetical protein